jgi:translation initiation factor IF-1
MDVEPDRPEPGADATVVELLPNATYRVRLDDQRMVLVHSAGSGQKNFVRLRDGDRVRVRLSPHDPTRGRVIRLL